MVFAMCFFKKKTQKSTAVFTLYNSTTTKKTIMNIECKKTTNVLRIPRLINYAIMKKKRNTDQMLQKWYFSCWL